MPSSGSICRRRPRPSLHPASACFAGALLFRGADSFLSPCPPAAAGRRVVGDIASGSTARSRWLSSDILQQHHVPRRSLLTERVRMLRKSKRTSADMSAVEGGQTGAGSDEAGPTAPVSSASALAVTLASDDEDYGIDKRGPVAGLRAYSKQQQQGQAFGFARVLMSNNGIVAEAAAEGGDSVGSNASDDSNFDEKSLYTLMGLCFLVAIVCALDRVAMSVAIVPMSNVYDYTDTTKGLVSSVFSWGYMASMIPSSVLIGVLGPKATMTAGVLVWSAAQMLSPAAAGVSLETLLACRFSMGIGEAVLMPSIQAIVAKRVPEDQKNGWLALIISGLQIGTVLAYWASPIIVDTWNWQNMFVAYGALGLVWAALWVPLVSERKPKPTTELAVVSTDAVGGMTGTTSANNKSAPAKIERRATNGLEQRAINGAGNSSGAVEASVSAEGWAATGVPTPAEDGMLRGNAGRGLDTVQVETPPAETKVLEERSNGAGEGRGAAGSGALSSSVDEKEEGREEGGGGGILEGFLAVPWKEYVTNGQIWTIGAAHMAHNWGLYVLLAWLPTYYVQNFNLSLEQSSGASVAPWVAGAITGNLAGVGADFLINKGVLDLKAARKVFQTVASAGPAMCMLGLAQGPETSSQASLLFTAAVALGSCSTAGFSSSIQDLRSQNTGVIYGLTSACSAIVGSIGTYLAGVILDTTDSWTMVFQSTAAVYLIGFSVYVTFYKAEPIAAKEGGLPL